MKKPASRAKVLASAAVTAGLCLAGTAAITTPSQAATGSCDTAFPVADLTSGQVVHGLTVSSGTTPSAFDGSVIGVLHDGIEPGVDMVMMELSSPEISNVGGIWEGMSGSPVYAADGSLIGAVAYTLSYGSTPIAGITPWEDMQAYAGTPAPPVRVKVSAAVARKIAAATDVTKAQASSGLPRAPGADRPVRTRPARPLEGDRAALPELAGDRCRSRQRCEQPVGGRHGRGRQPGRHRGDR